MGLRRYQPAELLRHGQREVRLPALYAADAATRPQHYPHERVGSDEDELLMRGLQRPPKSRGQAMVEFALLSGVMFLLVMGIFDFGRAISVYINIAEAAHEGARQLVLRTNYVSSYPDTAIVNATLAKIGGGGMVLSEDPCLGSSTPCASPSVPTTPNTGYIWFTPTRSVG